MALQTNEAELLSQAQQGNDEAFSLIVEAYQVPVYNLCYRMLGNARDAEDAAQETFIRAFKALKRYDPERKFSTWLLTIASNYCIDQHRRRRLTTFSIDASPHYDIPDTSQVGLERTLTRDEEQEQVHELLDTLGPKDRLAVIMRYWYDYSYDEIAESLSLSVSAVKSRLHRARRDLASEWLAIQPKPMMVERTGHGSPAF
jgi:RNA polymerase sigma-70 factor (ECF subfamily)